MELLVASALAVRRGAGADHLFAGVGLRLTAGSRVGLVGPNGSGKSTLLRLLAGQALPEEGTVVRAPGVRTALLDQDAGRRLAAGVASTGSDTGWATVWQVAAADLTEHERLMGPGAAAQVREVLAALGFRPERHADAVSTLSDGERQRLALAAVLASPADVVLLDEPTNHLDLPTRAWLERHLAKRDGAAVIVSHDRALLDAATDRTAFLGPTGLKVVASSHSKAARSMATAEAQTARRVRELEKEAARLDRVAAELAAHGAKAHSRRRRAQRDGAALHVRAAREAPAGAARLALDEAARDPRRTRTLPGSKGSAARSVHGTGRPIRGLLLEAEHLTVPGVLADATVRIAAGDRIALVGPNGSGKSTLLALLSGERPGHDPEQRLWYAPAMRLVSLDQRTRGLSQGVPVFDQGSEGLGREQAGRILAASGLPFAAWSRPPEELSGGERARVGLALALARPFDLLLLDEPDNDLDLSALEALEQSLESRLTDSGAALVIATHDRRLARALANRVWTIEEGSITAHGSVSSYLRGETGVPAETYWRESALTEHDAAERLPDVEDATMTQEELETERDRLLDLLIDPLALGDRESLRVRSRLGEVEGQLMSAYDALLPAAAPRYRLVERGLTLYADLAPPPRRAEPEGETAGRGDRLLVVAADDGRRAIDLLSEAEPDAPWLDVRLAGDVAHLRLGVPVGACLLPATVAALSAAGVRLAFTVMGARSAQLFSRDDLSATALRPVGDGWWRLSLSQFLASEGWVPASGARDHRTGDAGGGGRSRRSRRKAVKS